MPDNPWDYSQILLSNRAGAHLGSGIASFADQIGGAIKSSIAEYRDKKKEKEAEEATVAWLKKKGGTYFPGLDVSDDGEMKAVVKAAGGGRQAIQLISGLEAQEQQRAIMEQQQVSAQVAQARAAQQQAAAKQAAGAPTPDAAVAQYLQRTGDVAGAGGMADAYSRLEALREGRTQFKPELLDLGNGVTGMTTSRRSAIPVQKGDAERGPQSPQGKLLADADALEKGGRKAEAESLRKLATTPRMGGDKPMSATDWLLTGGDPLEYRGYVEGFRAEGAAPAAPQAGTIYEVRSQADFDKLPKGARFRYNGKIGTKN